MSTALIVCLCLLVVVACSYVLAKSCDSFEGAADFLGRKLPPGVKGATLNAIGSSLPELFTTLALLFFVGGSGVFGASIAITAGSAVFNSDIIPFACILAVTVPLLFRLLVRVFSLGMLRVKQKGVQVKSFEIDKSVLVRDGIALLIAQTVLIFLLGKSSLTWIDGGILMAIYVPYVLFMWWQSHKHKLEHSQEEEENKSEGEEKSLARAFIEIDLHHLLFRSKPYEPGASHRAWIVLGASVCIISVSCYFLGEAIIRSAEAMGVNAMVIALFLGAAASSVPDTILSVKDAMKGNYNDAISNAIGSNTFDICIALGLPLFLFGTIYGGVPMPNDAAMLGLRIGLMVITAVIFAIFLIPRKVRLWQATVLGLLYLVGTIFIFSIA